MTEIDRVPRALFDADPLSRIFRDHVRRLPVPRGQRVLVLRFQFAHPQDPNHALVIAALILDVKRVYMELRPELRRIYNVLPELYGPASPWTRLGFRTVLDAPVQFGGVAYYAHVLDFGPASVDGWLTRIVATELQVDDDSILDVAQHQLVLADRRVALTKLEFEVFKYLYERPGNVVERASLLRDVWGYDYAGGSNVIEALVKSLRRKLGDRLPRSRPSAAWGTGSSLPLEAIFSTIRWGQALAFAQISRASRVDGPRPPPNARRARAPARPGSSPAGRAPPACAAMPSRSGRVPRRPRRRGPGGRRPRGAARWRPGRADRAGRRRRGRPSQHRRSARSASKGSSARRIAQTGEGACRDDVPRRRAARQHVGRLRRGHALEGVDARQVRGRIVEPWHDRVDGRRARVPAKGVDRRRRRIRGDDRAGARRRRPARASAPGRLRLPPAAHTELDGGVAVHRDGLVGGPETQERVGRVHS